MYLIDTANIEEIKRVHDNYPIVGVTTNPTIVANERRDFFELMGEIRDIIGPEAMLHVQVLSRDPEEMVKEAKMLQNKIGGNLYIKVPADIIGMKGIKLMKKEGIKVTATAVCTQQQALMAACAGADFVAPYVNRSDDVNNNAIHLVSEIATLFKMDGLNTRILSASFKNVRQVHEVMMNGSHAVTIGGDLMDKLVTNALTDWSIDQFNRDWAGVYGEGKTTLDL